MNYKIKKVKRIIVDFHTEKIEVSFDKLVPNTPIVQAEMVLKTSRAEAKKLLNSMFDLKQEFLNMAEIEIADSQILSATQVSFKYHDDKGLGVQIVSELFLKDSEEPLVIKSPTKWENSKNEKERMSANLLELLNEVRYEACAFIDKEKDMQVEIFADEEAA